MYTDGDKSLPQAERTHFQVFLAKRRANLCSFFHSWNIGKFRDFVASLANLKNDDYKLTAKKLRLCHTTSREALFWGHTFKSWIAKENS
jgi:hypothetical protein